MARIRSVHPEICQSETMATLSAELERTFVRLWTHCDDEGRCEDRPKILKAALYPEHDSVTAESLDAELTLLARHGLVTRYATDGRRLIQVMSWDEYQHPQKPRPSKYAPPPVVIPDDASSPPEKDEPGGGVGEGDGVEKEYPPVAPGNEAKGLALVPVSVSPSATVGPVETVWFAYQEATGRHVARLDEKRRKVIANALKNYPVDDVVCAVRGWRHLPHNRGENDRNTPYNDLELLLRDSQHIERFRDAERSPPAAPMRVSKGNAALARAAARRQE